MDLLLDLIVTLSRWSRSHLYDISLSHHGDPAGAVRPRHQRLGATQHQQHELHLAHADLRAALRLGYGLLIVFATPYLAKGLGLFNNFTLAPMLILVFFIIGILADRN